ncbi:hypothetical protein CZP2022_146 [Vibrio phage C-ZP2022]|nr:hypothetical protein CZP2022_146 [Vibrio phage C-ZP2022]
MTKYKQVKTSHFYLLNITAWVLLVIVLLFSSTINRLYSEKVELNAALNQEELTREELESDLEIQQRIEDAYEERLRIAHKQIRDLAVKLNQGKEPYKPKLALTPLQNKLCLAIATFTEANGEPSEARETIAWAITNRAVDPRGWTEDYKGRFYKNNICAAVVERGQYSGMGPYITDIEDVVWGKIDTFVPALAKKHPSEMKAWKDIWQISSDIIDGKLTRKTHATYFISWRGLGSNNHPSWVKYFMPAYTSTESGLHSLFLDYGFDRKTGEVVYFTKANPYQSNKHTF